MTTVFFFNDTATTEIYTLSLHDALPIYHALSSCRAQPACRGSRCYALFSARGDRKSTRLNSSHRCISYAVFCLKKKSIDDIIIFRPLEEAQRVRNVDLRLADMRKVHTER